MKLNKLLVFVLFVGLTFAAEEKNLFSIFLIHPGTVSPDVAIPTLKWDDWDEKGPNELTAMGMREQYLLGCELRRRYNSMLDQDSLIDQVYIRMVDKDCAIMSGQAFLRGFLGDSTETLTPAQLEKADPPIEVEKYFKDKIGNKVLPSGISTLPFHTYYPHHEDGLNPLSCKHAHENNLKALNKTTDPAIKKIRDDYEEWFLSFANAHYKISEPFPGYIKFLESIQSAIYQYKETDLSEKDMIKVQKFAEEIYSYARVGTPEIVKAQTQKAFSLLKDFISDNVDRNLKDVTRKQNRRLAAIFLDDLMMVNILKRMNATFFGILPPSSVLTIDIKGSSKENLMVEIKLNDRVSTKPMLYKEFMERISNFLKDNEEYIKTYCDSLMP